MNKYRVAPAAGMSGSHTTRTSSSVQFEQGQGHSAAELCAIPTVTGSNGKTIKEYTCYNCNRKVRKISFYYESCPMRNGSL